VVASPRYTSKQKSGQIFAHSSHPVHPSSSTGYRYPLAFTSAAVMIKTRGGQTFTQSTQPLHVSLSIVTVAETLAMTVLRVL
jgi:hypothetical protein